MKNITYFLLLLFSCSLLSQTFETKLQTALTNAWSVSGLPGVSVSVSTPDKGMIYASAGIGNIYTSSSIIPSTTKYRIASATKNFTAVLIMKLQEAGYLNINDKLSEHLTVPSLANANSITISQLLNHTAGVGDYLNGSSAFISAAVSDRIFTNSDIVGYINAMAAGNPGTTYSYSNGGFFILGMLIEQKLGLTLDVAMQNWLFTPLGLTNTYMDFTSLTTNKIPDLAEGTRAYNYSPTSVKGSGAVVSTSEDLAKFCKLVYGETNFLSQTSKDALTTPSLLNSAYGMGTRLYTSTAGVKRHGHTGTILGYESYMYYIPSMHVSVGINTNAYASPSSKWENIKTAVYNVIEEEYLNYCVTSDCTAPAPPIPISPIPGQTFVDSPVPFYWNSSLSTGDYTLQVSKTNNGWNGTNGFTNLTIPNSTIVVNTLVSNVKSFSWSTDSLGVSEGPIGGTTYYFTIKSYDASNGNSNYSIPQSFIPRSENCTPPVAAEIIVDNSDATVVGSWTTTSATTGFVGTNYLHDGGNNKGTNSVSFVPNLPQNGQYEIFVNHTAGTNRATNAPFDVYHKNGITTIPVNQQINNATWVSIGKYDMETGSNSKVILNTTGTSGVIIADAVKFKFIDCSATLSVTDREIAQVDELIVYPNPTNGILTLELKGNIRSELNIFNLNGQRVLEKPFNGTKSTIDVSHLNSGIYIIQVLSEGISITKRMIKL